MSGDLNLRAVFQEGFRTPSALRRYLLRTRLALTQGTRRSQQTVTAGRTPPACAESLALKSIDRARDGLVIVLVVAVVVERWCDAGVISDAFGVVRRVE